MPRCPNANMRARLVAAAIPKMTPVVGAPPITSPAVAAPKTTISAPALPGFWSGWDACGAMNRPRRQPEGGCHSQQKASGGG